VNPADRVPRLLIVAGMLLLLAVVAYVINDAQALSRLRRADLRDQQALAAQIQRSAAALRACREEADRIGRVRSELQGQYATILESLKRIEKRLVGTGSVEHGCSGP
jgi:type II secretory pathway component PulM